MSSRTPLVTAPLMGYGHLRAAASLAEGLGTTTVRCDLPPLASPHETKLWRRMRHFYEDVSRSSQRPVTGTPARIFLDWLTEIPDLGPGRDLTTPTRSAWTLERMLAQGLHRRLVARLRDEPVPVLATFYSPTIAADRTGLGGQYCVVTDADVNRVWAPLKAATTRIRYLVPTRRAARRIEAFGVPHAQVEPTGFPLPPSLVGGEDAGTLKRNLAARLRRLDPEGTFRERLDENASAWQLPAPRTRSDAPPLLVFAVGGAGAQTTIVRRFLPGVAKSIEAGRLRLALVAGVRAEVAERLTKWVRKAGLSDHLGRDVTVLWRRDFASYYLAFNELLAQADVLWTKPGELVFYAGLGLPLVLAPAVGVQEQANARWVTERGAALPQRDPRFAATWLREWIEDGVLAGAAWSGFTRLPHQGTRRILEAVANGATS